MLPRLGGIAAVAQFLLAFGTISNVHALPQQTDPWGSASGHGVGAIQARATSFHCSGYTATLGRQLGNGSYGTVYEGTWGGVNLPRVAIKTCTRNVDYCIHGADVQKRLSGGHPGVVQLYTWCPDPHAGYNRVMRHGREVQVPRKIYTIQEMVHGVEMLNHIRAGSYFYEETLRSTFRYMLETVAYVASQGYGHRDLKPENFMVDQRGTPRLIDFDFATNDPTSTNNPGTVDYMSYEKYKGRTYHPTLDDTWALAYMFLEMATNDTPWIWRESHDRLAMNILNAKTPRAAGAEIISDKRYKKLSDNVVDLLGAVFRRESDHRISTNTFLTNFNALGALWHREPPSRTGGGRSRHHKNHWVK